ncbi:MAG: phosphotransferase [Candidatus Nanoarchaeia archaeon]|nr:phosphotransferase [Candidatus Nanoarchaeia archaeon]
MNKTPINSEEFIDILKNYDIGAFISCKYNPAAVENTVYLLKTSKGKYTFKIFESSSDFDIEYEVKFMEYLRKKGVPTQQVISDKKGKLFSKFKKKNYVILKYVEGSHPNKLTPGLIKEYAENISNFHKISLNYKVSKDKFWRKNKKLDHEFGIEKSTPEELFGFPLLKEYKEVIKEMEKEVDRSKLRTCVIHGDIGTSNTLVKNKKFAAFIDWTDCHKDYLVQDLAIFVPINKFFFKHFFSNYGIKLNFEEKKAFYYFKKIRKLSDIGFIENFKRKNPDLEKRFNQVIKDIINSYNDSKKLSLKDYLSIINKNS